MVQCPITSLPACTSRVEEKNLLLHGNRTSSQQTDCCSSLSSLSMIKVNMKKETAGFLQEVTVNCKSRARFASSWYRE